MFVKIQKGDTFLTVPHRSFVSKYKPNGYRLVEEQEMEQKSPERKLDEIPISEMNAEQLREFAEMQGIDTSNLRTAKALRDAIRGR